MQHLPTAIIGAGAAGLYAGYLLREQGLDFRIFEASDRYGGRMGKLEGFADDAYQREVGGGKLERAGGKEKWVAEPKAPQPNVPSRFIGLI